jgi:hypothetical protein
LNRRSYCIRLRPTLTNKSFFGSFFSKKELLFSKKRSKKTPDQKRAHSPRPTQRVSHPLVHPGDVTIGDSAATVHPKGKPSSAGNVRRTGNAPAQPEEMG